jgi:hypothetical protein
MQLFFHFEHFGDVAPLGAADLTSKPEPPKVLSPLVRPEEKQISLPHTHKGQKHTFYFSKILKEFFVNLHHRGME